MALPLSIIIPTYNEEQYLPKLLDSIKKQTKRPKEIIVSDAFSTDNTRKIAKEFGCKVVDGGLPAKGRNMGAEAATQPTLLFLDADVLLPPRFLEDTVNEMNKRKLDIATCFVTPLSTNLFDIFLHEFTNFYFKVTRVFSPRIAGFCVFVSSDLHKRIKGFDESLMLGEEHDFAKRAIRFSKFGYLTAHRIPVSVRRIAEEGRLKFTLQYIAIDLHILFLGRIRKNIFNYRFGHQD